MNDHLEKIGGFQIERSDSIDVENGKVYWRYNVLANPSPSTLIPNQHVSSEIGTVDRNGWVYLPSGRRVLLSGLKKWAKEHTQATPRKINGLIDALISPFHIEANSKQYGIFIGGTGMHFYGVGNVERLYNIYSGTKFYYGGVGNPVEYDSLKKLYLDNATGLGWETIVNRIEADLQTHYKSGQIVHIFGWSRGGAMAHEFTKKMEKYGIRVAFLGMFDPVYSHTLPGQNSNHVEWTLTGQFGNYVTAIQTKNAKAISVIYAINEDRSFFPATQFYPDKLSKVKLFKSPGGHGEIGGHFQSNLIVQRMNMRAMLEFASLDGKAEFQYLGLDTDLVRIYGSRLTQEIAVGDQDSASTQTDYDQYRDALELDTWKPMNATEYLQAFVDFTPAEWSPGAFGYQQDYWTGPLAWGAEFVVRRNEISFPWIKQVPLSHYSRNLSWVPLELWDLEMLKNPIANNIITEQKKAHIRHIYGYKINPKIGGWMP